MCDDEADELEDDGSTERAQREDNILTEDARERRVYPAERATRRKKDRRREDVSRWVVVLLGGGRKERM